MAVVQRLLKDPNATVDYTMNWEEWLSSGETISASEWTVPTGITLVLDNFNDTSATGRFSGGTAGTTYRLANKITTTGGEIDERSIDVIVVER